MNPLVEAAWISLLGAAAGVTSAVIVAWIGFRTTRKITAASIAAASADIQAQIKAGSDDVRAQIEADRNSRVWEKQAAVYVEALEAVHYWQVKRQQELQFTPLGDDESRRIQAALAVLTEPNWHELEPRLQAFASEPVFTAMQESNWAEAEAIERFKIWQRQDKAVMAHPNDESARGFRRVASKSASRASMAAEKATNHVIEVIRTELQGSGPPLANRTYTERDRLRDHLPKDPGTAPAEA